MRLRIVHRSLLATVDRRQHCFPLPQALTSPFPADRFGMILRHYWTAVVLKRMVTDGRSFRPSTVCRWTFRILESLLPFHITEHATILRTVR